MLRPYYRHPHDSVAASLISWSFSHLLPAYNWPSNLPGGTKIAIVELGGTWYQADMNKFFPAIGQPLPMITNIGIPKPDPMGADIEVELDIYGTAAGYFAAVSKPADIRVYFVENTFAGFMDAIKQATADGCDVMSCSWGAAESQWGSAAAMAFDAVAFAAVDSGMALFAAAGDSGYRDSTSMEEVDFPASSPHFIACGGTRKIGTTREVVWHATGGGYSRFFVPQVWQTGSPPPPAGPENGRMVSDVAANADPQTGYQIIVHGRPIVIGGTSAVAPLYAGLIAALGPKPGFIAPKLWANPSAFHPITHGTNGKWPGNVCCGLGAPNATAIASALMI